jgi:hypothetical protein
MGRGLEVDTPGENHDQGPEHKMSQSFVVEQKSFLVAHDPAGETVRVYAETMQEAAEELANGFTELGEATDGALVFVKNGDRWWAYRCERVFKAVSV